MGETRTRYEREVGKAEAKGSKMYSIQKRSWQKYEMKCRRRQQAGGNKGELEVENGREIVENCIRAQFFNARGRVAAQGWGVERVLRLYKALNGVGWQ